MYACVISLFFLLFAAGVPSGRTLAWKPAPRHFDIPANEVRIVLTDPLPNHWAIGVVPGEANGDGRISVASVHLDGALVDRVDNLGPEHLDVKPGMVRVKDLGGLPGVAICVTIPLRTEAIVSRKGLLVARSSTGLLVQDGMVVTRNPKACGAVPALEHAILHEGSLPVE